MIPGSRIITGVIIQQAKLVSRPVYRYTSQPATGGRYRVLKIVKII